MLETWKSIVQVLNKEHLDSQVQRYNDTARLTLTAIKYNNERKSDKIIVMFFRFIWHLTINNCSLPLGLWLRLTNWRLESVMATMVLSILSQWLCYDDSTINIVVVIIFIIIRFSLAALHYLHNQHTLEKMECSPVRMYTSTSATHPINRNITKWTNVINWNKFYGAPVSGCWISVCILTLWHIFPVLPLDMFRQIHKIIRWKWINFINMKINLINKLTN